MHKSMIGDFIIANHCKHLIISDPCYSLGTWCMGKLDNPKKGLWTACIENKHIGGWGLRVSVLEAVHCAYNPKSLMWDLCPFEVGVDSGQAGIFSIFPDDKGEYGEEGGWYNMCCEVTLSNHAAVIEGGVVSRSGLGDGGYDAYSAVNDSSELVGVKIVFISDDDETL